jgi:hypothetical protein
LRLARALLPAACCCCKKLSTTLRQLHSLETRRGSCGTHPAAMTARRRGCVAARCRRRQLRL